MTGKKTSTPEGETPYAKALRTGVTNVLKRLRKHDPLELSASMGAAFTSEGEPAARRVLLSSRLKLLNEQLEAMNKPAKKPAKNHTKCALIDMLYCVVFVYFWLVCFFGYVYGFDGGFNIVATVTYNL